MKKLKELSFDDIIFPRALLRKKDKRDGWIYICPTCKSYICHGDCRCGQIIDWMAKPTPYMGKYHYKD